MNMKDPEKIILAPQISEKSGAQTETRNCYFFKVHPSANKPEIKRAVETLFKVTVSRVNTMNLPGKPKRERTMKYGHTAAWKRAVVKLKEGDSIDLT